MRKALFYPCSFFSLEVCTQKEKNNFDLKVLLRRIIPFCIVTLIYLSRLYFFTRISDGFTFQGGVYKINFSLNVLFHNLLFYMRSSFNSRIEYILFLYVILLVFLKDGNRKFTIFSLFWFFSGLLPFIFLETFNSQYYLMVSLFGFSLLLSIGIKDIYDRFCQKRYVIVPIILLFYIISRHPNSIINKDLYVSKAQDKIVCNISSYLKKEFPYLPDGSIVYIKRADDFMWRALGHGSAISLNYDNNISVYFEGVSKNLPAKYSYIYYFIYDPEHATIRFIENSDKNIYWGIFYCLVTLVRAILVMPENSLNRTLYSISETFLLIYIWYIFEIPPVFGRNTENIETLRFMNEDIPWINPLIMLPRIYFTGGMDGSP